MRRLFWGGASPADEPDLARQLADLARPGALSAGLAWYRAKIVPARAAHGFTIEFAFADREVNEFVWAVSTPGDAEAFAEIEKAYLASPEREAAFAGEPTRVAVHHVRLVERIV